MIEITDVSSSGASAIGWECNSDRFQLVIGGTFDGESVTLERRVGNNGSWVSVDEISSDSMVTVENIGMLPYRLNTSSGGGSPSLSAVVIGPSARSVRVV